jgi:DNA-binding NarL/FixJ family response regulator
LNQGEIIRVPKLSVLLACNETLPAEAIAEAFNSRSDIVVVGTTNSGVDTIEMVDNLKPDVLIIGVHLFGMDGIESARVIHQKHPKVSIIFLSAFNQKTYVINALNAGAVGFLPLTCKFEALVQAIHGVKAGLAAFDISILDKLVTQTGRGAASGSKSESLNVREIEILRCVASGKGNRDIAKDLYISPRTVQSHLANIFRKLNVTSRTEAVTASISKGYLEVKDMPDSISPAAPKNDECPVKSKTL